MRMRGKRAAQVAVLVVALGFLLAVVWRQWAVLRAYPWHITPVWLLLGIAGLELVWIFEAATWNAILAGLGGRLSGARAARAWFLSNIIRYIPGNVWQFLGMIELAAEDGVPRVVTAASIAMHQVILTATGLALAALYFGLSGQSAWSGMAAEGGLLAALRPLLLLVPVGLILLQPRLLEAVLNRILVRLRRPPVQVTLTWAGIWLLVLRYAVIWLGEGLSFACLVRALMPFAGSALPQVVAAWLAAYMAGYLSLLTPSGLGVREAAMVAMLAPVMPVGVAAIVAIAVRLFMVLAEALGAGGALLLCGRPREDERRGDAVTGGEPDTRRRGGAAGDGCQPVPVARPGATGDLAAVVEERPAANGAS